MRLSMPVQRRVSCHSTKTKAPTLAALLLLSLMAIVSCQDNASPRTAEVDYDLNYEHTTDELKFNELYIDEKEADKDSFANHLENNLSTATTAVLEEEFHLTQDEIREALTISHVFGNEDDLEYELESNNEDGDGSYNNEFDTLEERIERILQRRLENIANVDADVDAVVAFDEPEYDEVSYNEEEEGDTMKGSDHGYYRGTTRGLAKKKKTGNNSNNRRPGKKPGRRPANNSRQPGGRPRPATKKKRSKKKEGKFTNRVFRNICLDPPDIFRTCFARAVDPLNDVVGCDKILRNEYNLAAQCHKRGKECEFLDETAGDYNDEDTDRGGGSANRGKSGKTVKSSKSGKGGKSRKLQALPDVYAEPYLTEDEVVTEGTMHLALLQDSIKVDCNEMIRVEEAVLNYLQKTIGNEETFRPACAYVDGNALAERVTRSQSGRIVTSVAMKINVRYTTRRGFKSTIDDLAARRLLEDEETLSSMIKGGNENVWAMEQMKDLHLARKLSGGCASSNHHLCCSQESINADVGGFCRNLGCNFSDCGGRSLGARPPGRPGGAGGGRPGGAGGGPQRPGQNTQPNRPQQPDRPQRPGRPNRPSRPSRPGRPGRNGRDMESEEVWLDEFEDDEQYANTFEGDEERELAQGNSNCRLTGLEDTFMQQIHKNTGFERAELARSLLNDTDTSLVASCALNWHTVRKGGISTLTCDEYQSNDCQNHEDLEYEEDESACVAPSTMPSESPY